MDYIKQRNTHTHTHHPQLRSPRRVATNLQDLKPWAAESPGAQRATGRRPQQQTGRTCAHVLTRACFTACVAEERAKLEPQCAPSPSARPRGGTLAASGWRNAQPCSWTSSPSRATAARSSSGPARRSRRPHRAHAVHALWYESDIFQVSYTLLVISISS